MEVPQKVIEYLNETRAPLPAISGPDEPLHLDSLALIRFMAFLERDLGICVQDDELHADNFETLGAIAKLLESKSPGGKVGLKRPVPNAEGDAGDNAETLSLE